MDSTRAVKLHYDAAGRLWKREVREGVSTWAATETSFDADGNVTTLKDADGNTTYYEYEATLGRLARMGSTRGRSRMRESCTYGSVRGARVTGVPTVTTGILLAADPTSQGSDENLPGLEHHRHSPDRIPRAKRSTAIPSVRAGLFLPGILSAEQKDSLQDRLGAGFHPIRSGVVAGLA